MTEPGSSDLSEEQRLDSPDVLLAHIRELRQIWPEPEEKDLYDPAGKVSALWGVMYRFGWSVSPPPEMSTGSQFFRLWMEDTSEGRAFRAEQWRKFHEALSIAEDEARKHDCQGRPKVKNPQHEQSLSELSTPPDDLLMELSPQSRNTLRFLWSNRKTSTDALYRHLYSNESRTSDALRKAVERLNQELSEHTKGNIQVVFSPPDVFLKFLQKTDKIGQRKD